MPYKILVADDDVDVLAIYEELLVDNGYQIIMAQDGLDALAKVKAEKPDLIILDVMMPKLDGHNVNMKLKENPETASIPVFIVTAYSQFKKLFEISEEMAVTAYFEKPFCTDELLAAIKKILK